MSFARVWIKWWRINRMFRAVGAAVALFAATGWMWWVRSHPPTAMQKTRATVTEIVQSSLNSDASRLVRITLDDGRRGQMFVPSYAARAGSHIPVVVEEHDGGDDFIMFDLEQWVDEAGSN